MRGGHRLGLAFAALAVWLAVPGGVAAAECSFPTSVQTVTFSAAEKANRRSQAMFACRSCGHAAPADYVAAVNIGRRGEVMRPKIPLEVARAAA